jgi:GTP-binding protein LepA
VLGASGKTGEGVAEVLNAVVERIPPPREDTGLAEGLIFDFGYDSNRGIIVYMRVFGGNSKKAMI